MKKSSLIFGTIWIFCLILVFVSKEKSKNKKSKVVYEEYRITAPVPVGDSKDSLFYFDCTGVQFDLSLLCFIDENNYIAPKIVRSSFGGYYVQISKDSILIHYPEVNIQPSLSSARTK